MQSQALSSLLWHDPSLGQLRAKKSASALVAIQQILARREPLAGREREFLALYRRAIEASPDVFASVWSAPTAYAWVRQAYDLLRDLLALRESAPQPASDTELVCGRTADELLAHLDQFKRFALAIAWRSQWNWDFERPLRARLPMDVPSTRVSLSGPDCIEIAGFANGFLQVLAPGGDALAISMDGGDTLGSTAVTRHVCPILQYRGCRLLGQAHAFSVLGNADPGDESLLRLDYQWQNYDLARQALEMLCRYDPASFDQFCDMVSLVCFKPFDQGEYGNTSYSQLPGAFVTTAVDNPLTLAADFIHEMYHHRLFALEDRAGFFEPARGIPWNAAEFYSPWRSDPRPLQGVFHALYVFTRLCRFWLLVYSDESLSNDDRAYVADQLVRTPRQLLMATHVLDKHATFTDWGNSLFQEVAAEARRLTQAVANLQLPVDTPACYVAENGGYLPQTSVVDGRPLAAAEAVREHRELYDLKGQCEACDDQLLNSSVSS